MNYTALVTSALDNHFEALQTLWDTVLLLNEPGANELHLLGKFLVFDTIERDSSGSKTVLNVKLPICFSSD